MSSIINHKQEILEVDNINDIDGVWGIYAPNPNYPVCYNCLYFNMLEVRHKPVKIGSGDIMYEEWYFCPLLKENVNIWSNGCYPVNSILN